MNVVSSDRSTQTGEPSAATWMQCLKLGQDVELHIYGDRMAGRLSSVQDGVLEVHIPIKQQAQVMRRSTVYGTAVISIEGGAASAPVSCWPVGDIVRMRVVGPVEIVQRRLHVRAPIDVSVVLTWPGDRPGTVERVIGKTADISMGGLRVQSANTVWPSLGVKVTAVVDLLTGSIQVIAESLGKTPDSRRRSSTTPSSRSAAICGH